MIQVVDIRDGNVSEPIFEDQNKNFLWMRQKPVANTPGPGTIPDSRSTIPENVLFALGDPPATNNNVVKITEDEGTFMVIGDWNRHYKHEEVNAFDAKGIAYARIPSPLMGEGEGEGGDVTEVLSLRRPTTGLHLHENLLSAIGVNTVTASFEVRTIPDTRTYTVMKTASNGKMMFGVEPIGARESGLVYHAPDTTLFDPTPGISEDIQFLTGEAEIDHDENFVPFFHKKTHAFDVDGDYAIVVWEDDRGNLRLRITDGDFEADDPIVEETVLGRSTDYTFKDIQAYHSNSASTNPGRALLLDSQNNRIGIVKFNGRRGAGGALEIRIEPASATNPWINLGAGKNPQAFVLNSDKTKAYIINKGDETVSEITLKDSAGGTPRSAASVASSLRHINVSDYFPDKDFTYKPTHAAYLTSRSPIPDSRSTEEFLVIGMEDMKGSLVLPITVHPEPVEGRPQLIQRPINLFNNLNPAIKTNPPSKKTPSSDKSKFTPPTVKPLWFDSKLPAKDGSSKKESPKGKSPGTAK